MPFYWTVYVMGWPHASNHHASCISVRQTPIQISSYQLRTPSQKSYSGNSSRSTHRSSRSTRRSTRSTSSIIFLRGLDLVFESSETHSDRVTRILATFTQVLCQLVPVETLCTTQLFDNSQYEVLHGSELRVRLDGSLLGRSHCLSHLVRENEL
jgi:hypothetical protein